MKIIINLKQIHHRLKFINKTKKLNTKGKYNHDIKSTTNTRT